MKFWGLGRPKYRSDHRDAYINGSLKHPLQLPRVICDVCGCTWGGSQFLPYCCPESLRSFKFIEARGSLALAEHKTLQEQVFAELGVPDGKVFVDLRPGARFQPGYLDVPSTPRADFLWPNDAVLVVSERIKDLFLTLFPADISVHPVILRKVGNREAKLPVPQVESGEPEDVIKYVLVLEKTAGLGPYFEVLPRYDSRYSPDRQPTSICSACGRIEVEMIDTSLGQRVLMSREMWTGQSIFRLTTTLAIVVTDDVRKSILAYGASNVEFTNAC